MDYDFDHESEEKHLDTYASGNATASGTLILVNGVPLGTDDGERIGRVTYNEDVNVSFTVKGTANLDFRISLIEDRQPSGSLPAISEIINTGVANTTIADSVWDNRERFTIIRDLKIPLSTNGPGNYHGRIYQILKSATVFQGTGNTIASINSKAYYLMVLGYDPLGATTPQYDIYCRFVYTDQ